MPYVDQSAREDVKPVLDAARIFLLSKTSSKRDDKIRGLLYKILQSLRSCSSRYQGPDIVPVLQEAIKCLVGEGKAHLGWLNYFICALTWEHVFEYGEDVSYSKLDRLIGDLLDLQRQFPKYAGTLWCAMTEIYRRIGVPYEEKKAKENGDVFIPRPVKRTSDADLKWVFIGRPRPRRSSED